MGIWACACLSVGRGTGTALCMSVLTQPSCLGPGPDHCQPSSCDSQTPRPSEGRATSAPSDWKLMRMMVSFTL